MKSKKFLQDKTINFSQTPIALKIIFEDLKWKLEFNKPSDSEIIKQIDIKFPVFEPEILFKKIYTSEVLEFTIYRKIGNKNKKGILTLDNNVEYPFFIPEKDLEVIHCENLMQDCNGIENEQTTSIYKSKFISTNY